VVQVSGAHNLTVIFEATMLDPIFDLWVTLNDIRNGQHAHPGPCSHCLLVARVQTACRNFTDRSPINAEFQFAETATGYIGYAWQNLSEAYLVLFLRAMRQWSFFRYLSRGR